MKELTHKGRSWRGPAVEPPRTVKTKDGWTITQVKQIDGSWWNIRMERTTPAVVKVI